MLPLIRGYERLDFIFSQLTASARERHLPALVGEWGAFYLGKSYLQSARHQIGLIEKYNWDIPTGAGGKTLRRKIISVVSFPVLIRR